MQGPIFSLLMCICYKIYLSRFVYELRPQPIIRGFIIITGVEGLSPGNKRKRNIVSSNIGRIMKSCNGTYRRKADTGAVWVM